MHTLKMYIHSFFLSIVSHFNSIFFYLYILQHIHILFEYSEMNNFILILILTIIFNFHLFA